MSNTLVDPIHTVDPRLKKIICEQLGVEESEVTPGAHIIDDLGADSLDTIELVMEIEDAFELQVPDEEVSKFTTVQSIEDYVTAYSK